MINTRTIIFFDFETGGKNASTTQPLELAAVAINPRKLEVIKDSLFHSYIKPWDEKTLLKKGMDKIEEEALAVNKLTLDMLESSPTEDVVWKSFCSWVYQFNVKKSSWEAPIAAHFNGINFDMKIVERLCSMYDPWDKKRCQQKIFNPITQLDLSHVTFMMNENNPEVDGNSMGAILKHLEAPTDGQHSASWDTLMGAELLCRYLRMIRSWSHRTDFKW